MNSNLEIKYKNFLESLEISIELSEKILSMAENNDIFCFFDSFFEHIYVIQYLLNQIYKASCNISKDKFIENIHYDDKIVELKAYNIEKILRENEDIYVDINKNLKDIFKFND